MFTNYFKTGWRNLLRDKLFSVIKIAGLSIGLSVCMLILLYTKDEVSYDQFHENKARIFRIVQEWKFGDSPAQTIGITNSIVGESFAQEIPEIQKYARVNGTAVTIQKNHDVFTENPLFVDDNFFSVFTFRVLEGDPGTALKDINSIVLSENLAKKYFGTTDVIGETILLKVADDFESFKVTALVENSAQNSTIKTDMLMPMRYFEKFNSNKGWFGGSLNTFLLLSPRANTIEVERKMQALFDKNTTEQLAKAAREQGSAVKITLRLQPLTDIHLSTSAGPDNGMADGSKPVYSYILTCIALFILVIACINFINLAVAQSLRRSKEIGIRKVVGGTRKQLMRQFLIESFLVSLIAFAFAIFLTELILPFFNELANKKLNLSYLSDGYLYAGYFALLMITSFIAGFYPSLVLSAFQPVDVLYSKKTRMGKNGLTKGLVVFQFALAIFLIIGTIAVNKQLNFLLTADLGYRTHDLVRIDIPVSKASDRLPSIFKSELTGRLNILRVAARNGGRSISGVTASGKTITIEKNKIDDNFLPTLEIPVIAGRNFSAEYPSDSTHSVIVNESFVKEAGWTVPDAVGKTINYMDEEKRPVTIVGVIKDYHFTSLKEKITPELFCMEPAFNYGQIWVRINAADVPQTLSLLQKTYKKILPYFPYTYQFMDEINAKNYEAEAKWKKIIGLASSLFIFISLIGLLGLVILSIEQRTKEIGIRKVLGAALSGIVALISREFMVLICIAFVAAAPAGYYAIHIWLQDFAYRVDLDGWMFVMAGAMAISVSFLVVSVQAIRAGLANPARSLRSE